MTIVFRQSYVSLIVSLILLCTANGRAQMMPGQDQLPSAETIAAAGTFEGQMYRNKLLGFSILAPGGWKIFDPDQNRESIKAGRRTASIVYDRLDPREQAALKNSVANTTVLFQASSRPDPTGISTAILSGGVERPFAATTKEKYAAANKKLVLLASPVQLIKDIYNVTIGGVGFTGFDIEGRSGGKSYKQTYLVTIRKGTALFLVSTLKDDKNAFAIEAGLKTVKFGK